MLKTLDILIGATTILLIFSMAVTVITQAITGILNRKGRHLKAGLSDLLRQLGIADSKIADTIAEKVLTHPMIAVAGRLGSVIHRDEFTKLLLDLGSGDGAVTLEKTAKDALVDALKRKGIPDPAEALKNIHDAALRIEASNPEIANHVRDGIAVLHGASSEFVARMNSWFDQCIDRVTERFTQYTHAVVVGVSLVVVLTVQLDIIAVVSRLSIDDQFRDSVVKAATSDFSNKVTPPNGGTTTATTGSDNSKAASPAAGQSGGSSGAGTTNSATGTNSTASGGNQSSSNGTGTAVLAPADNNKNQAPPAPAAPDTSSVNAKAYYDLLNKAGLLTLPFGGGSYFAQLIDARKWPGMLLSVLLLSLGAPFWFGVLKQLLSLRSALATKDDAQREHRQSTQSPSDGSGASGVSSAPNVPKGETGDLAAVG